MAYPTFDQLEGMTFEQVDQVFLESQRQDAWAHIYSQVLRLIQIANRLDDGGGPYDVDEGVHIVVRGRGCRLTRADEIDREPRDG